MTTTTAAAQQRGFAHFRIDGADLTRIARDLFLEDQPNRAWRLVAQGLRGDDSLDKVARGILDGDLRLVGDETRGMDAVEDTDSADYKHDVRWLYAGRVRVHGVWYRPRAIVTRFGPTDAEYATRVAGLPMTDPLKGYGIDPRWAAARVLAYGLSGEIVLTVQRATGDFRKYGVEGSEGACDLLFEPCSEPPHWWPENTTPDEAFAQFEAAGRDLDREGYEPPLAAKEATPSQASRAAAPVSHASLQQEREDIDRQDRAHRVLCSMWRKTILERNGGEMLDLTDEAGNVVATVPKRPFMAYALERTEFRDLAPWEPVCPSGLKLQGDSPAHSDWFVGMGGTLENGYPYDSPLHSAAVDMMFKLQEQVAGYRCAVLVAGAPVVGTIGAEIVVLPNLDPKHLPALLTARAVITEQGGELAHHRGDVRLRGCHEW